MGREGEARDLKKKTVTASTPGRTTKSWMESFDGSGCCREQSAVTRLSGVVRGDGPKTCRKPKGLEQGGCGAGCDAVSGPEPCSLAVEQRRDRNCVSQ